MFLSHFLTNRCIQSLIVCMFFISQRFPSHLETFLACISSMQKINLFCIETENICVYSSLFLFFWICFRRDLKAKNQHSLLKDKSTIIYSQITLGLEAILRTCCLQFQPTQQSALKVWLRCTIISLKVALKTTQSFKRHI